MKITHRQKRLLDQKSQSGVYSFSLRDQNKATFMTEDQDSLLPLIIKIAEGDEASMSAFYKLTVNRVYGMALKVVSKPELAEEVVGDVYLQVWRKAKDYNAEKAVAIAWLLMMCRSRSLDKLRREKSATMNQFQQDEPLDVKDEGTEMPFDNRADEETSNKVTTALKLLNKNQRQAVALAFYKGMSHQEIADYTSQPLGTVKSNIRRAQAILRNAFDMEDLNNLNNKGGLYGKA